MNNDKIKQEIMLLTKKPEMWIGVSIILALIIFSTSFFIKKTNKVITQKAIEQNIISPIITSTPPTSSSSANINKDENNQIFTTVVKKLADTAGEIDYKIVEGDSYWKITEKVCGISNNFETIQSNNQKKDLQPGEIIKVICE